MLSIFRRKFRIILQRTLLLTILAAIFVFAYSYVNLEFCYRIMSHSSMAHMCLKYKNNEYSGSLCEELCSEENAFKDFKCPQNEMKTIVFTAEKNDDVYAVKLAKTIKDDLSWTDKKGWPVYPKIEDFHHIVKMHIITTYNVTLDDSMIRALVNQEIDKNNAEQMLSFWRLFRDNNYMMGKLFDEESLFPTILGSCGPYYATENLNTLQTDQSIMQYISSDWQRRLKYALNIMEFIFRLDDVKPEPLKVCKMKVDLFGLTADKRLKYQNAGYIQVESQVDKRLSSGTPCTDDADCNWHQCMGKCEKVRSICTGIQQNNNLQIFCEHLLIGGGLHPGLLTSAKTPKSLLKLVQSCAYPSKDSGGYNVPERAYAPNSELALRLYNELKRLQKTSPRQGGDD